MKNNLQCFRLLIAPILCVVVMLFLSRCAFFIGYVPSASMEPAVPKDSLILGVRAYNELSIGDIIIFKHDNKVLVKRVVATAGDIIARIDGSIMLVPERCYYVLGDNSGNSIDSRYWDEPFVKANDVLALLLFH